MTAFSLLDYLAARAVQVRAAPTITDARGNVLAFDQLLQRSETIGRGFRCAGLRSGDRVLFAVRPSVESTLLMVAIAAAGGVVIPFDATMGPALFESRIELIRPRWVVAESILYAATANRWVSGFLARRGINLPRLAAVPDATFVRVGRKLPGIPATLSSTGIERLGEENQDSEGPAPDEDAAAIIIFTSGTTATPKAVVHSRRSMQAVLDTVASMLAAGSGDIIYARELHLILPAICAGAAVVIPPNARFSARRTLHEFRERRVTHYFGVAAEIQQIVDHLQHRRQKLPHTLREIWIGAAPVRAPFLRKVDAVLGATTKVWCVYGMTEILPVARVSLRDKLRYDGEGDLVGHCVQGVEARIAADGELFLRGPNLFNGYYGEPECSELATGDLARLQDGQIVLLGRRKDMIIRRQFNVYPELYESKIEGIEGVQRCAMIGLCDDDKADEQVVLVVEPHKGVDEKTLLKKLWHELREGPNSIDPAALPNDILLMAVPVSGRSHKVDKQKLRELVKQDLVR